MDNDNKLQEFVDTCWKDVFAEMRGAAVYIDHAAAECLHWYTGDKGFLSLKDAGALSVHELAMYNFRYIKVKGTKKAVIIYTSTDPLFYQRTLKMIIEKNTFESCTIVCAAHFSVLNYTSILPVKEESSYDKLKEDVLNWMNSRNPLQESCVEIMFRPIFIASINENLFVTPPFGDLLPPIDKNLTEEHETNVNFLVSSLHSLFTYFNTKEDIYSIGKFSEYVADKLENLPAAIDRRKRLLGQAGVSLILVDRTLDLCTATSHNTESLLGRILSTLPHLPHHYNDIAVNMSPLCLEAEENPSFAMVPGCLASDDSSMINLLIAKKQKEVLLTLNKLLIDMSITKDSPKTKITTRVSAHSLEKLVHKFRDTESIESLALSSKKLQQIIAVIQALKSEKTAQLELLISLEKLILQNLAISRDSSSVLAQLSSIIKTRTSRGLDMENLLVLLIHIYALAGTEIHFSTQQEKQLEDALVNGILEDIKKCNESTSDYEISVYRQTLLLLGVTDDETAKISSEKITQRIMELLRTIAGLRRSLQNYESIITKSSPQEMARCVGLLEHLVTDLLDPNKPEIRDLQQKTSSLISAGFNLLLKGRKKQHPSDNPWIIIYVLGGITAEEVKIVEGIVSSQKSYQPRVTLAGSRLLNPLDIADKILSFNVNI